jgi:hypothetical protein
VAEEEAVLVTANVSGESVPMSGVRVTICKMNVTAEGEQLNFRVMEMTTLQTGADGKVQYNFSEGSKYMICAENQEQKTYLYSGFDRIGVAYVPSQTNFVWLHTHRPVEAFEALLAEGVIVRGFGAVPALRVTTPSPADAPAVINAFEAAAERLGGFSASE